MNKNLSCCAPCTWSLTLSLSLSLDNTTALSLHHRFCESIFFGHSETCFCKQSGPVGILLLLLLTPRGQGLQTSLPPMQRPPLPSPPALPWLLPHQLFPGSFPTSSSLAVCPLSFPTSSSAPPVTHNPAAKQYTEMGRPSSHSPPPSANLYPPSAPPPRSIGQRGRHRKS